MAIITAEIMSTGGQGDAAKKPLTFNNGVNHHKYHNIKPVSVCITFYALKATMVFSHSLTSLSTTVSNKNAFSSWLITQVMAASKDRVSALEVFLKTIYTV